MPQEQAASLPSSFCFTDMEGFDVVETGNRERS